MNCSSPDCLREAKSRGMCRPCYTRVWRAENAESLREKKRAQYEANKAVVIERVRQQRLANPEAFLAYRRSYYTRKLARPRVLLTEAEKRTRRVVNQQRREARKRKAPVNDFTLAQWIEMRDEAQGRCYYCQTEGHALQQEHKIPLSRGGSHTRSNIVPACGPCNNKKRSMTDVEFLAMREMA